ncbi:MAG: citramalate synthase [Oscillospiraceae bacterium]
MKKISIFDSTLRDGAQAENITFTVEDKLNIVKSLDKLGVDYIEAGNPGSNPKDLEFFSRVKGLSLNHAKLVAFGSTRRRDIQVEEDKNVQALLTADTEAVAVFGKSWELHVTEIIKTTPEENLRMITDTISFFVSRGKTVFFDAEHFFDGYKANPDYALQTLYAAERAGAACLVLCDTNGGCFPDEISAIVADVVSKVKAPVGIHCHDDIGCAVANSIAAVKAGAVQVQGTYIGYGERCGNANLSAIIPSLQCKLGYECLPEGKMERLSKTARYIADISNMILPNTMPYVGKSAFAHKGGMHVDGVTKNPRSFEHIPPETVGNRRNVLLSEVSGKAALLSKLELIGSEVSKDSPEASSLVEMVKTLEYGGYQFESATASLELLALKHLHKFKPFFEVTDFKVIGERSEEGTHNRDYAMIKIKVGERCEITADEGDGPVHALDIALRKAVGKFYPAIEGIRLIDYKVRVIEPKDATAAQVRVFIETTDGENTWTTVSVSSDVINASLNAVVDSVEYKLLMDSKKLV